MYILKQIERQKGGWLAVPSDFFFWPVYFMSPVGSANLDRPLFFLFIIPDYLFRICISHCFRSSLQTRIHTHTHIHTHTDAVVDGGGNSISHARAFPSTYMKTPPHARRHYIRYWLTTVHILYRRAYQHTGSSVRAGLTVPSAAAPPIVISSYISLFCKT